jgi:predicted nucleic acid-binding protein
VNPYWLDTSLLLRLLTGDPPPLAEKALRVFREAEEGRLLLRVRPLVVAEAFYTLVHSTRPLGSKVRITRVYSRPDGKRGAASWAQSDSLGKPLGP